MSCVVLHGDDERLYGLNDCEGKQSSRAVAHDAAGMHSTTASLSVPAAAFIHDNTITSTLQSAEIAWPTLCAIILSNAAGAEAAIKACPPS